MVETLRADEPCVLSLSYGKDSLAYLNIIERLGWPLNRIVHAEVWATDTIPADPPEMMEFKVKADAIIKKRWGIEVEHVRDKRTYEQCFYQKKSKKAKHRAGLIYGWPFTRTGAWCNNLLKVSALPKVQCGVGYVYIGIAADEPSRFHSLTEVKKSPLVEAGWTEEYCRTWCEENGLLSPIYSSAMRGGCWFCHNQPVRQLRLLRKNYPEYWTLMLKWDADSPVSFHPDGRTVHDFDRRFQMEDDGFISPDDKHFRWDSLDTELNYRWF